MKKILLTIICMLFIAATLSAFRSEEFLTGTYTLGAHTAGTHEVAIRDEGTSTHSIGGHVLMKESSAIDGEAMNPKNYFVKPLGYSNNRNIPEVASQFQPCWQWEHEQYEKPRDCFLRYWQDNEFNANTNPYWQWEHEQYKSDDQP